MKKISLVLPTINREKELYEFFISIKKQNVPKEWIEIIVVDQNNEGFLDNVLNNNLNLDIIYIHSHKRGLSFNRNIGVAHATGEVIAFPDDDCTYYADTIHSVLQSFKDNNSDFVIGQINDRESNQKIFRNWPDHELSVTKLNFYFLSSSIAVFIKKEKLIKFDENMGVGTYYGAVEDADFVYRLLCKKAKGKYFPSIRVCHPKPDFTNICREKVVRYASGFGYLVAKHRDIYLFSLLSLLVVKKLAQKIESIFNKGKYYDRYFQDFFKGLCLGIKRVFQ